MLYCRVTAFNKLLNSQVIERLSGTLNTGAKELEQTV